MTTPTIYVACLASYNSGILYGVRIDATQDADDIRTEIATMLRGSKCPNVLVTCPVCDGRRENQVGEADQFVKCDGCKGEGKVPSAEEFAIHDHEGFEGLKIGEHESIDKVACLARCLEESDNSEAFVAFYNNGSADCGNDADEWLEAFRDAYVATYDSVSDYAFEMAEECGDLAKVPEYLKGHIDWESLGRDLVIGGDVWMEATSQGVAIFRNI